MKLTSARRYKRKLTDAGIDASLRKDYSGRGMYGQTTAAVVLLSHTDERDAFKLCPGLKKAKSDSMGLGIIFY